MGRRTWLAYAALFIIRVCFRRVRQHFREFGARRGGRLGQSVALCVPYWFACPWPWLRVAVNVALVGLRLPRLMDARKVKVARAYRAHSTKGSSALVALQRRDRYPPFAHNAADIAPQSSNRFTPLKSFQISKSHPFNCWNIPGTNYSNDSLSSLPKLRRFF